MAACRGLCPGQQQQDDARRPAIEAGNSYSTARGPVPISVFVAIPPVSVWAFSILALALFAAWRTTGKSTLTAPPGRTLCNPRCLLGQSPHVQRAEPWPHAYISDKSTIYFAYRNG